MLAVCPIFVIDAGCAAVNILCRATVTTMRLPLACKVMTKVAMELSTYFGMSNFVGPQLLLEAAEQLAPGLLSFRH